jgi:hypothetical protein
MRGLCECGCGEQTKLVRGRPRRFRPGHNRRATGPRWEVRDCGYETPCHVWLMARQADGYGIVRHEGVCRLAHRVAWATAFGDFPQPDLEIDHLCRNRACVNIEHLQLVTAAVNVRRGVVPKLDAAKAEAIREAARGGARRADLARAYGVGWTTIDHVLAGRTWRP